MDRTCGRCGDRLGFEVRADARYCSTRCRVAAHRAAKKLPKALTSRPRWVRHRDKVPLTADGKPASSTDQATWTSYVDAAASPAGDGLGFVLNGDGLACLDLDHALEDGQLVPWAAEVLAQIPPTYVEVSPSGEGLHVWGTAKVHVFGKVRDGRNLEFYTNRRYLTVTGRRWADAPDTFADLDPVYEELGL